MFYSPTFCCPRNAKFTNTTFLNIRKIISPIFNLEFNWLWNLWLCGVDGELSLPSTPAVWSIVSSVRMPDRGLSSEHMPQVSFSQVSQRGSPSTLSLKSSESRQVRSARLLFYQHEGELLFNRKKPLCGASHCWKEIPAWHLLQIHPQLSLTSIEAAGGMAQHETCEKRSQENRTSPCCLPPAELYWGHTIILSTAVVLTWVACENCLGALKILTSNLHLRPLRISTNVI